jgi:outer membrane protein OmpA-like peptidoglycan-associated protein
MKKALIVLTSALFLLPAMGIAAQSDSAGCKDHPVFTRMPGYWIHSCIQKQFDAYAFAIGKGKTAQVEGQFWNIRYYPNTNLNPKPSDTQILRNFENAVQKLGGTVVASEKGKDTLKLTKDGKEIWIEVWAEFTGKYGLVIVQKDAMAQDVVANAEVLSNDIRTTGHASVYGIYFDNGKSTIKSESAQAIGEIAKLLKADPGLKIYVVGHTDNVGSVESNIKLSQDRAEAVLQALVRDHGIAPARLRSYGCGLFAPVAANDTEEGRAKNRRVELVIQ